MSRMTLITLLLAASIIALMIFRSRRPASHLLLNRPAAQEVERARQR